MRFALLALLLVFAAPAASCPMPAGGKALAAAFLSQVNAARAPRPALAPEARLTRAAQSHACDNARRGSYTHRGGDGSTLAQRLARVRYPYRAAAENTGWNFHSAQSALKWWMGSPPHRANLMNRRLREIGIGIARGRDGALYWVLDLGAR